MEIITVPTTRNLHNAINPAIKSLNYLNNILAKIEAINAEGFRLVLEDGTAVFDSRVIVEVLDGLKVANSDEGNAAVEGAVREKVVALTDRFPMYPYM